MKKAAVKRKTPPKHRARQQRRDHEHTSSLRDEEISEEGDNRIETKAGLRTNSTMKRWTRDFKANAKEDLIKNTFEPALRDGDAPQTAQHRESTYLDAVPDGILNARGRALKGELRNISDAIAQAKTATAIHMEDMAREVEEDHDQASEPLARAIDRARGKKTSEPTAPTQPKTAAANLMEKLAREVAEDHDKASEPLARALDHTRGKKASQPANPRPPQHISIRDKVRTALEKGKRFDTGSGTMYLYDNKVLSAAERNDALRAVNELPNRVFPDSYQFFTPYGNPTLVMRGKLSTRQSATLQVIVECYGRHNQFGGLRSVQNNEETMSPAKLINALILDLRGRGLGHEIDADLADRVGALDADTQLASALPGLSGVTGGDAASQTATPHTPSTFSRASAQINV